ncbi:MAG: DUF2225 domain-containing protein, partial [Dehalococcoidia bacterium]
AALAETPYDVTARALEAVEVLCVPEERLLEFYQAAPALGLALAREVAEQLVAAMPVPATEADLAEEQTARAEARAGTVTSESAAASAEAKAEDAPAKAVEPMSIAPSLTSRPKAEEREAAKPSARAASGKQPTKKDLGAFYTERLSCPLCSVEFDATRVRTSALNATRRESDLRTIYDGVNPVHYSIYVCPNCQYAAYEDDWSTVRAEEREQLLADTAARRRAAMDYSFEGERDGNTVMVSYLLALRSYDLRAADPRRRGGILQRLAWVARELGNAELEQQYLQIARGDYAQAFETDEELTEGGALTLAYLLGDLALRLEEADEAARWFERAMRMSESKKHPEIARLTRERWADARALRKRKSA